MKSIISVLLCAAIALSTVIASPIGPFHIGNNSWAEPFGIPTVTPHDQYLHDLIGLIPANASVLTDNDLFPQVAQRINAYVFPFSATFKLPTVFNSTLDNYLQESDYILYDGSTDPVASVVLQWQNATKEFGLYAEADGAVLLRKGYTGNPVLFVPIERVFNYEDLVPVNSSVIQDPFSESGKVLYHWSANAVSDCWYGPGYFIARGNYVVDFRLKLVGSPVSQAIAIAVIEWPTVVSITMSGSTSMWFIPQIAVQSLPQDILSVASLTKADFNQSGSYQTFSLEFSVNQPGGFEFVGLGVPSGTGIYLDNIRLSQVAP